MKYTFAACQSFAGGFDMGATQAGLELVHKVEQVGGFGLNNVLVNRHLLGYRWESEAADPETWHAPRVNAVLANPPCSGFSLMTHKDHRGADASINSCMHRTIEYAARCDPQVVVFESVQQAYTQGIELMRTLHAKLEALTGDTWNLMHILHNAYVLGGSSIRRRYFWCASRIPFGIDPPRPKRVPVLDDVIGDLEGMSATWEHQPYRRPSTWWLEEQGMRNGQANVDGHIGLANLTIRRNFDLITPDNPWPIKKTTSDMLRRYYEMYGDFPESWQHLKDKMLRNRDEKGNFKMGFIQPCRWNPQAAGRVITGAGMLTGVHPHENRMFTHREVARIMGFPDDWKILPNKADRHLASYWGKGITTQCGRWIGGWIIRALDGEPSGYMGEQLGEREWVHQSTHNHRHLSTER
jgi:site-specific DNA-cytosine methylase